MRKKLVALGVVAAVAAFVRRELAHTAPRPPAPPAPPPPAPAPPTPPPRPAAPTGPRRGLRGVVDTVIAAVRAGLALGITDIAATLAYYAFLAIPAIALVAVGAFGVAGGPGTAQDVVDVLDEGVVPDDAVSLIRDTLARVTASGGQSATLAIVGLVLALWTVSGAMQALMRGLNRIHGCAETRSYARLRATAVGLFAWVLLALIVSFGLLVFGTPLAEAFGDWVGGARPRRGALVGVALADRRRGPVHRDRGDPAPGAGAAAGAGQGPGHRRGGRGADLGGGLGGLRRLRLALRHVRGRLGLAVGGHRDAHLALADEPGAAAGSAARGGGGPAGGSLTGVIAP